MGNEISDLEYEMFYELIESCFDRIEEKLDRINEKIILD